MCFRTFFPFGFPMACTSELIAHARMSQQVYEKGSDWSDVARALGYNLFAAVGSLILRARKVIQE